MEETVLIFGVSWAYWLLLLAVFLASSLLGIGLLRMHIHQTRNIEVSTRDVLAMIAVSMKLTASQTAKAISPTLMISVFLFGMVCFYCGYFYRDHVLSINENSISNTQVIDNSRRAEGWYDMRLRKSHKEFPVRFCPGTPEFPVGTVFDEIKYEDRGWCWAMAYKKLGFIINMEETRNEQSRAAR